MDRKFAELPENPFEDNIVHEPRDAEPAVADLNEPPLQTLLDQFALLERDLPPRRRSLRLKAQLVTSAEPGYGKSHLVGRLFKALEKRATLVYLRPFQDARSFWRSILLMTARELQRADGAANAHQPNAPTQLDAFAAGVLAGSLLAILDKGTLIGPASDHHYWSDRLRRDPLGTLGFTAATTGEASMAPWLRQQFADGPLPTEMASELGAAGLTLHAPAGAWLRVLLAYGLGPKHGPERAMCLRWLKGESLETDEAATLGLRPADVEASREEASAASRNEDAWRRLQDLFALAGYHRPFLLCFDQTELYTSDPALAAEFGAAVEFLVSYGLNHLAVVTTNLSPWRDNILPHIQTALRARFSAPLELSGIQASQARALAQRRLENAGLARGEIERFFDPPWFENYFRESPTASVRSFLDRCGQRCRQLGGGLPPRSVPTLEESFQKSLRAVETGAQPLGFDPNVLQWALGPETAGDALPGVTVERFNDPKGHFQVRWRRSLPAPEKQILFGCEDSSDGRTWSSIVGRIAASAQKQEVQGVKARFVFLRTPEQPALPNPAWEEKQISVKFQQAVDNESLTIQTVSRAELAMLHAARALHSQTMEGNTPFGHAETKEFVREKLTGWWNELIRKPMADAAAVSAS
jgi:hypothetical protein